MRNDGTYFLGLSLIALAGCSGNGQGLDSNGRPLASGLSPLVPELQSIQDHVFTPICSVCHAGASAPLGFRLDQASAFAMLVNAPSVEVPSLFRVLPGNPDQSYMVQKIEGHAAVGSQMPLGEPPLPQATIDVIRQWIANGATQSDGTSASIHRAIRLHSAAPVAAEQFVEPPAEMLIAADGELDTSSINESNVHLVRTVSSDGGAAPPFEVRPLTISIRSLTPTVVSILPPRPLAAGHYRMSISSRGPAPVSGRDGMPIAADLIVEFDVEPNP
jgi:hypothetical protein